MVDKPECVSVNSVIGIIITFTKQIALKYLSVIVENRGIFEIIIDTHLSAFIISRDFQNLTGLDRVVGGNLTAIGINF